MRRMIIIDQKRRKNHESFDFGMFFFFIAGNKVSLCRNLNSFPAYDRQSRVSLRDAKDFRLERYGILKPTFCSSRAHSVRRI